MKENEPLKNKNIIINAEHKVNIEEQNKGDLGSEPKKLINNTKELENIPKKNDIINTEQKVSPESKNQPYQSMSGNDQIYYVEISKEAKQKSIEAENKLLAYLKKKYEIDMIYEDTIIDDSCPNNFIRTLRTKDIKPDKPNFVLFHGYMGNSYNFVPLCPFMYNDYNLFLPDYIGCGCSGRVNIKFKDAKTTLDFFIEHMYKYLQKLGFLEDGKKFYIGGHSLGGYFVSKYVIKYPKNISKVLFLSAAGITDKKKAGTDLHKQMGCCLGCLFNCACCCYPCEPRVQSFYNCCCTKCCVKCFMSSPKRFDVDKELVEIFGEISIATFEFPKDLEDNVFYIFSKPPPGVFLPSEDELLNLSNLSCVFTFGGVDWMDRDGALRLCAVCPSRFSFYLITKERSHLFPMESPKETYEIIKQEFM